MTRYKNLLSDIRDHLARYSASDWQERIEQWIAELDDLKALNYREHLLRTRRSLGGMGSIGDIVICPEAGHKISPDLQVIKAANVEHLRLVKELYREVT